MSDPANKDELITEFCDLTGAPPEEASQYLEASRWDLPSAATEYFTSQDDADFEPGDENITPGDYTGPRTLDGRPAPGPVVPSAASAPAISQRPKRKGFATLDSLNQAAPGNKEQGHSHDDDNSDDEDYQPRDLFAGGEKSGLAVQDPRHNDPRSIVKDLLQKAQMRPGGEPASAAHSHFRGTGITLGSGESSQSSPQPRSQAEVPASPVQTRVLHLWNDGFSIDDGPLYRFDDPQNAEYLAIIRSGRAPLRLMNVDVDQPVDVKLRKHGQEDYNPPPKVYKPFGGSGRRLGSPTPGSPSITTTSSAASPTAPPSPDVNIDPSQPTVSLRIQLANGTRLPARFNSTHTIGDVYAFVARSYPDSGSRPWVLATIFPNKDHTDKNVTLGEVPEFRRGGTAVQKWV